MGTEGELSFLNWNMEMFWCTNKNLSGRLGVKSCYFNLKILSLKIKTFLGDSSSRHDDGQPETASFRRRHDLAAGIRGHSFRETGSEGLWLRPIARARPGRRFVSPETTSSGRQ